MSDKAKFRYSAKEGVLELEDSEEFVSKHFEELTDIVRVMSRHVTIEQKKEQVVDSTEIEEGSLLDESKEQGKPEVESINSYPSVFSEINGKLKIVTEIPGDTKKAKMTNVALLYCYGSELIGDAQVSSKDIRSACEEHGCLDGGNFSSIFNDKTIFLSDGVKGGNKQIKLSFQGKQKAKTLLVDELYENQRIA